MKIYMHIPQTMDLMLRVKNNSGLSLSLSVCLSVCLSVGVCELFVRAVLDTDFIFVNR